MRIATSALMAAFACGGNSIDTTEPLPCIPGADGAYWGEEDHPLVIDLGCLSGQELVAFALSMPDLPDGASFDRETAQFSWTPTLEQAAVWHLDVTVDATGEQNQIVVGIADAFDHPDNLPIVDREQYPLEYGIPVLFLEPGPSQSDVDEPVTVTYRGRTFLGEGQRRGASSLAYPKKSYLLKFQAGAAFTDEDADFIAKRRVVLTSTFDDNAYIRQRLAYELWNDLQPNLPIMTYSVVVYLGDSFHGLYTVTDHPSKHWLDGLGLRSDANLYKAVNHDANFRTTKSNGQPKSDLWEGYEKKEGTPLQGQSGAFADLELFVDFVATSDNSDFAANLNQTIDLADYEKWWALVMFSYATDSAGKNSYHYHDPELGRWMVTPWDFNASFGQSWQTYRLAATSQSEFGGANELFQRVLDDPGLGMAIRERLQTALVGGPFSSEQLDERLNALSLSLLDVAQRDERHWGETYRNYASWSDRNDFVDFVGEVDYVRQWIDERRTVLLELITP